MSKHLTVLVLWLVLSTIPLPMYGRFAADINADGEVSILDDAVLRRSLAGLGPGVERWPDLSGGYSGTGFVLCEGGLPNDLLMDFVLTQSAGGVVEGEGIVENLTTAQSFSLLVFATVTPDGTVHGTLITSAIAFVSFSLVVGDFADEVLVFQTTDLLACIGTFFADRL